MSSVRRADVKPDRRIKRRSLGGENVLKLFLEYFRLGLTIEIIFGNALPGNSISYSVNKLLK